MSRVCGKDLPGIFSKEGHLQKGKERAHFDILEGYLLF